MVDAPRNDACSAPVPLASGEYPAPDALARRVLAALPPEWRTLAVVARASGLLVVRFRDEAGRPHVLEARPLGGPAFLRGERLAFAHGPTPPGENAFQIGQRYRAIFEALRDIEAELAPWILVEEGDLRPLRPPRAGAPRVAFVLEHQLMAALGDVPAPLADGAVERWLTTLLGESDLDELHLHLDSPCRQACEFCAVPGMRGVPAWQALMERVQVGYDEGRDLFSSGLFARLLAALARLPNPPTFGLTGNDWAENPHAERYLDCLAAEPRLRVTLTGPSTRLADPAFAARVAALPNLSRIALTLIASDAAVHDDVVGRVGAWAEVCRAIEALIACGAPLRINTVLTARAVAALPATLTWAAARGWRLYLMAFEPDVDFAAPIAELLVPFTHLHSALSGPLGAALAAVEVLAGVPLCAVPPPLVSRVAPGRGPGEERGGASRFPTVCDGCGARQGCAGVSASYSGRFGSTGLVPLGGPQ